MIDQKFKKYAQTCKFNRKLGLVAVFLAIILYNVLWQPSPNSVKVTVGDIDKAEGQFYLQLYYHYDLPFLKEFKERQSSIAIVDQRHGAEEVQLTFPGFQSLGDLRLDFGMGDAELSIKKFSLVYNIWPFRFTLASLTGKELATIWQPNDSVQLIEKSSDYLRIKVTGDDPFVLIPEKSIFRAIELSFKELLWLKTYRTLITVLYFTAFVYLTKLFIGFIKQGELLFDRINAISETRIFASYMVFVTILAAAVYWPYLTLDKIYLFNDVANDSVDQFWPIFRHLSLYLRKYGWPLWSFSQGVGQNVYGWISDPFTLLHLLLFPGDSVIYGFGWIQFLKQVLAAALFFWWFRLLDIHRIAAIISATMLAFSAHMVIRSDWVHYATEVVVVGFAFVAIELYLSRRIWLFLPWVVFLLVGRGVFHTYVWTLILFAYVCCRLYVIYDGKNRPVLTQLGRLSSAYILGLFLSCVLLIPNFYNIWNSARLETVKQAHIPLFQKLFSIGTAESWLSALYGIFAPDIIGRGIFYTGFHNYLEGPHLYAGLLVVFLLPQVFHCRRNTFRIIMGLAMVAAASYIIFPGIRYVFNAFVSPSYKLSSFWISIVFALGSAFALDTIIRNRTINLKIFFITIIVSIVVLYLLPHSEFINQYIRVSKNTFTYSQVIILLCCYCFFLILLPFQRTRHLSILLILITLFVEVNMFAGGISKRKYSIAGDVVEKGTYYYDNTRKAINYIKSHDQSFYRIAKVSPSVHFNDPLGQEFNGITSYNSFNSREYIRFLGKDGFGTDFYHRDRNTTSYIKGVGDRPILQSLLNVKYYIARADNSDKVPSTFVFWKKISDVSIFKNSLFISMGAFYNQVATEEDARILEPQCRDILALQAAIISIEDMGDIGVNRITPQNIQELTNSECGKEVLSGKSQGNLSEIVSSIRTADFNLLSQNKFVATIVTEEPGIIFFSVPSSNGWTFVVNGTPTKPFVVHYGMFGVKVSDGRSYIEGKFIPPMLKIGLWLSLFGLLLYISLLLKPILLLRH